ncbi:MAG: hypothetical protein ACK4RS_00680 [Thiothrix sp.]
MDKKTRLLALFTRLLPLLDSVTAKLRFAVLLGIGLVTWIFVWLYAIKDFALSTSLIVAGITLLPILLLAYFWWSLAELKDLPMLAGRMFQDAKAEIGASVQDIQAGKTPKLSLLGSAKSLWSIGALVVEARELLGSYLSIGVLMNPVSLLLGALALVFVFLLGIVGVVLALIAIF